MHNFQNPFKAAEEIGNFVIEIDEHLMMRLWRGITEAQKNRGDIRILAVLGVPAVSDKAAKFEGPHRAIQIVRMASWCMHKHQLSGARGLFAQATGSQDRAGVLCLGNDVEIDPSQLSAPFKCGQGSAISRRVWPLGPG